jgi:hypothetical protein
MFITSFFDCRIAERCQGFCVFGGPLGAPRVAKQLNDEAQQVTFALEQLRKFVSKQMRLWGPVARTQHPSGLKCYLAATITKIVNGHPNSRLDELLPWVYPAANALKDVA